MPAAFFIRSPVVLPPKSILVRCGNVPHSFATRSTSSRVRTPNFKPSRSMKPGLGLDDVGTHRRTRTQGAEITQIYQFSELLRSNFFSGFDLTCRRAVQLRKHQAVRIHEKAAKIRTLAQPCGHLVPFALSAISFRDPVLFGLSANFPVPFPSPGIIRGFKIKETIRMPRTFKVSGDLFRQIAVQAPHK